MSFEVKRYKGNKFGIISINANAFVLFGLKKDMIKRCKELNKKYPN
jgi:hypothetical protein